MTRLRLCIDDDSSPLAISLREAPWGDAAGIAMATDGADAVLHLVTRPTAWADVVDQARGTGLPTLVAGPGIDAAGTASPLHEIRVRAGALGVSDDVLVSDRVVALPEAPGEVLATANIAYADLPVARWDATAGIGALAVGSEPRTWQERGFLRLVHRLLHRGTGTVSPGAPSRSTRVALLGYGAIGNEHAAAIRAVDGLDLALVCDLSADRLREAQRFNDGVATTTDPSGILSADDIDLVVVSTPPNTHGRWARELIESGKHVVLEKPMALTTAECDDAIAAARAHERTIVVYQNRRFDPDFRAIAGLIDEGALGEVFHLEAFVGGYQHPCNYWHSDASVSGGALFDWGSHLIDQILQLMPGEVATVTARNHKRMWHDVTNADQARMTLHYSDGREATFIYSDLAAALKPRWYLAGTRGGLVGTWRQESVVSRSPIGTLAEDVLAPADAPPELWLHGPDGRVSQVPGRPAPAHEFHRELAALLTEGLPMTVTAAQSRRVVSMLEAAEESARLDGAPVVPA